MKVIVIVDAYSSGEKLVYAFKSYGYRLIHIQSSSNIPATFKEKFDQIKNLFIDNIIFDDDVFSKINQYKIKCIIPGTESGVMVADLLCHSLNLETANNLSFSSARRDKNAMHLALRNAGLTSILSCKSRDLNEIKSWIKNHFPQFENGSAVVVKPLKSAGTDNVYFCYSENDVENAYTTILRSPDLFEEKNTDVLVQAFQKGEEYIINAVSYDGIHFITDVWQIKKKEINRIPIYDFEKFITVEHPAYETITSYTKDVLNALHIKYGASHTEIILTDNGPVLIETGARLMGTCDFSSVSEVTGYNQISKLVESYINPDQFLKTISHRKKMNNKHILNVFLISNASGKITNAFNEKLFKKLSGLHSFSINFPLNGILEKTHDLVTSPGHVYLVSENLEDLTVGYNKIREMEKTLYKELIQI